MYFNPLVSLIWLGALVMFFGGVFSLTDRRYRVGAPKRKPRPPECQRNEMVPAFSFCAGPLTRCSPTRF